MMFLMPRRKGRVSRRPSQRLPLRLEALEDRFLPSGTPQLLKDINTHFLDANPTDIVEVNGAAFFAATSAGTGNELWRSDGTAGGTQIVKDINPGSSDSYPKYLTNVGGTLFFSANDGTTARSRGVRTGRPPARRWSTTSTRAASAHPISARTPST